MANAAASAPLILTENIPLCEGIDEEKNGNLKVQSVESLENLRKRLEGVFSVVIYYQSKQKTFTKQEQEFKSTPYYKGILHMLRIVHREGGPFANWGLVLYTNLKTNDFLQAIFPFSEFPKLCLVLVDWPFYNDSTNSVDTSILRCLRFQVLDLFPNQICLIRDADTLFQRVLDKTLPSNEEVTNQIEAWEAHFVKRWLGMAPSPPMVMGTSITYHKEWHTNTPLALAFPFDVNQSIISRDTFLLKQNVTYGINQSFYFSSISTEPIFGVYAGFVNVTADKSMLADLWRQCVTYLQSRFFMARYPFQHKYKRFISNSFSYKYYGAQVGKDEKCMLFVMCRYYLPAIYFYDINYNAETALGRTMEHFYYLIESTKPIQNRFTARQRGYSNENITMRKLVPFKVPTIETHDGTQSHLLNPESIDVVLDKAVATMNTASFQRSIDLDKTTEVLPLHEFYHRNMRRAMDQYERWLATTDHKAIYETLKQQLKTFSKTNQARFIAPDLNSASDDLFLQSAGIFSLSDEEMFAEKYKINKAEKNAEKARQASAELAAQLAMAPKGGYHRTLKRRIRQIKHTRKHKTFSRR